MLPITDHIDQALGRLITQYSGEKIIPPVPPVPPTKLKFLGVGHSYVQGTISGLGTTGNSYRREMYYRCRSHYGMSWSFVGLYGTGDIIPIQYSCGVASQSSSQLNAAIEGYLVSTFPVPTIDDCVLLGPIGFADCLNSVPLVTYNANLVSIIDKIHTHSHLIRIFLLTDPECSYSFPPGQDITDYADEMKAVYADTLAAGKNVFLVDLNLQSINIGPDNIHPDWLGYEQMGEFVNDMVANSLNVPAINLITIMHDTFIGIDNTLLKNHSPDIDIFGTGWSDPNDRCEVLNNYCHQINVVSFYDTLYDTKRVVGKFSFRLYTTTGGQTYVVFKSDSAATSFYFLFLIPTTNELAINSQGGRIATVSFPNNINTWYDFTAIMRGNSVEIFDNLDNSLLHIRLPTTVANLARIGMGGYTTGDRRVDDYKFESY